MAKPNIINQSHKRLKIIVGHCGSGKTEFSVNYALMLAKLGKKAAIIDLDILNPYFRSREKQRLLEKEGIHVFGNVFDYDITAEIPALSACIKTPLEDCSYDVVIDVGGDAVGARVLNQFDKYFNPDECDILCVINMKRPETATVDGVISHINEIEKGTKLKINGFISNTHLLGDTTVQEIVSGYNFCKEIEDITNTPIVYVCGREELLEPLKNDTLKSCQNKMFPLKMIMREEWMGK